MGIRMDSTRIATDANKNPRALPWDNLSENFSNCEDDSHTTKIENRTGQVR